MKNNIGNKQVPKKLSITRWSAKANVVKALHNSYSEFKISLDAIIDDPLQKPTTTSEAKGIKTKMEQLETGIMFSFWQDILTEFDKTNKLLQRTNMNVLLAACLYDILLEYINRVRTNYDVYEQNGKMITKNEVYMYDTKRVKIKKAAVDEGRSNETKFSGKSNF